MTQSLTIHEEIRKHINFVEEKQNEVTNEALGDIVGKAKTWWASRAQKAGQKAGSKELDHSTNEHAKWLGVLMGRQGIDYPELTLGNMRNYLKTNNINLDDDEIKQIFDKVGKEHKLNDVSDDAVISTDKVKSQQIAKSIIRQGIMKAVSKKGLGQPGGKSQQQSPAQPATGTGLTSTSQPNEPSAAGSPKTTPKAISGTSPTTDTRNPAYLNYWKDGEIIGDPALVVDIAGKTVKVYKFAPSKREPAGWAFYYPDQGWTSPEKGDYYDQWFNDLWAARTMRESTVGEIKSRSDDLLAAKQAEQQGDKATQYEKLADYHEKFSKVKKLKPADRVHHTTQAGIYRNAAQAVRSAQETLSKSSK